MPKEQELKLATLAAEDDGYSVADPEAWFDEMDHPDGRELYPGYMNIGMYVGAQLVRNFAIRIATGDVVDMNTCTIFGYANLMQAQRAWMRTRRAKPVSLDKIADELACGMLKVVPVSTGNHVRR